MRHRRLHQQAREVGSLQLGGAVDGRDDRESCGVQVEQVLLAQLVALARQLGEDLDAGLEGRGAEAVVGRLVVDDGAGVADGHDVEGVHE